MRRADHSGQSLVEYVFVLALIALVVISAVVGLGQRSADNIAGMNQAFDNTGANPSGTGAAGLGGAASEAPNPHRATPATPATSGADGHTPAIPATPAGM